MIKLPSDPFVAVLPRSWVNRQVNYPADGEVGELADDPIQGEAGRPADDRIHGEVGRPADDRIQGEAGRPTDDRIQGEAGKPADDRIHGKAGRPADDRIHGEAGRPTHDPIHGEASAHEKEHRADRDPVRGQQHGALLPEAVDVRQLAAYPFLTLKTDKTVGMHEQLLQQFRQFGEEPRILCECSSVAIIVALVAAGIGATILPKSVMASFAFPDIVAVPISGPGFESKVGIVWLKNRYLPTSAQQFIDTFLEG
ncbi:hypothetical protein EBB07_21380 [Paenibacillaceae bacterium]|nr:hypothetical protein EBB07_21380 [Paenibacillaceae bacterium]